MTAKQYLSQLKMLDAKINQMLDEKETLKCAAERITPTTGEASSGGGVSDRVGDIVARMADLDAEINECKDRLHDMRITIKYQFNALPDVKETALLQLRYLEGISWKMISHEMKISLSAVHRLNKRSLQDFEYYILR